MANVTAQDVKALREKTGVGMMECKKALTQTNGDFQKAVEFLREKGLAAVEKKAGRIAAEGMVNAVVCPDTGIGVIVEINSETDFVSKNADFQKFVSMIARAIIEQNPQDLQALFSCKYVESDLTVEEMLREKILTIGENIRIRRFARYETDTVNVAYTHMGGVIGVLVALEVSENIKTNPEIVSLGKDIGMQIAAMRPQWLCRNDVPADVVSKETEILMAQTMNEGKPEAVAQKIVAGRINKFYQENCLVDQAFVKENKMSVKEYVDAKARELGGEIKIASYIRFEKGEGIEKKEDNFAEEVAKMSK